MCTMKEITVLADKSNYPHQLLSHGRSWCAALNWTLFRRWTLNRWVFRERGEVLSGVYRPGKWENSCQINKSTRAVFTVSPPRNRQCIRRLGFHVRSMNRWQVFLWEYRHPEKSMRPLPPSPSSRLCNSFLVDNGRTHRSSTAKTYPEILFYQNNSTAVHCGKIT